MRCPECNEFVSFKEEEAEIDSIEIDEDGTVQIEIRITNSCSDCHAELTEAYLDIYSSVDLTGHAHRSGICNENLKISVRNAKRINKMEDKDKGVKKFYGARVLFIVSCSCGFSFAQEATDYEEAYNMESLV